MGASGAAFDQRRGQACAAPLRLACPSKTSNAVCLAPLPPQAPSISPPLLRVLGFNLHACSSTLLPGALVLSVYVRRCVAMLHPGGRRVCTSGTVSCPRTLTLPRRPSPDARPLSVSGAAAGPWEDSRALPSAWLFFISHLR